jgi:hypothetical protein
MSTRPHSSSFSKTTTNSNTCPYPDYREVGDDEDITKIKPHLVKLYQGKIYVKKSK